MVLISTYTFLVSKTLINNLYNLSLKGSLRCSRKLLFRSSFCTVGRSIKLDKKFGHKKLKSSEQFINFQGVKASHMTLLRDTVPTRLTYSELFSKYSAPE